MTTISFVTLGVGDIDATVEFYCTVFDLAPPEDRAGFVVLETGATKLGFYPWDGLAEDAGLDPMKGEGFAGVSLCHNVITRNQVDTVWKRALQCGGAAIKTPEKTSWGGYAGYFADLDGHLWEVVWNPHWDPVEWG